MKLGSYTFDVNPNDPLPIIRAALVDSVQETLEGEDYIDWGFFIGQDVPLDWKYCSKDQFDSLDTIYTARATVVWDPEDGSGRTFNVRVRSLTADWSRLNWLVARKNVHMVLRIQSEVVE